MRTSGSGANVASSRIVARLREQILAGQLQPGERIRQEDIAKELGASRIPVREALRILQDQGLVTLKSNSGAWVSKLNLPGCESMYKIRERLEPLALSESIPNLTSDHIARLEEIQGEIERNDDPERFLALDRELHHLTYHGCQDPELKRIIDRLWNTTQPYRRAYVAVSGPQRRWIINAEHRLLIDAITRADAPEAESVIALHIRRTRVALARRLDLFED